MWEALEYMWNATCTVKGLTTMNQTLLYWSCLKAKDTECLVQASFLFTVNGVNIINHLLAYINKYILVIIIWSCCFKCKLTCSSSKWGFTFSVIYICTRQHKRANEIHWLYFTGFFYITSIQRITYYISCTIRYITCFLRLCLKHLQRKWRKDHPPFISHTPAISSFQFKKAWLY